MLTREEKITSCNICPNHCFFKVTVEDGKILEVKAGGITTKVLRNRLTSDEPRSPDGLRWARTPPATLATGNAQPTKRWPRHLPCCLILSAVSAPGRWWPVKSISRAPAGCEVGSLRARRGEDRLEQQQIQNVDRSAGVQIESLIVVGVAQPAPEDRLE